MANIRPVSDLQRRLREVTEMAKSTGEPVYLTRNGSKHLVVIDAERYDQMAARLAQLERVKG